MTPLELSRPLSHAIMWPGQGVYTWTNMTHFHENYDLNVWQSKYKYEKTAATENKFGMFFFFFLTRGWRFQNLKSVKMDFKRLLLHAVQHPRCFEHDGRLSIDILMLKWLLPATVERLARPARVEVGWRQTQTQIWPQRHRIVLECDKSDLFSLLL